MLASFQFPEKKGLGGDSLIDCRLVVIWCILDLFGVHLYAVRCEVLQEFLGFLGTVLSHETFSLDL